MPHPPADSSAPRRHPYPGGDASHPPFRLTGLHRADGLAGPPRRYLGIVALLAGAASLPLITAVVAGPGAVGGTALGDISPFLAPPSGGPVIVPLPPAPGIGDPGGVVPGGAVLPVVPLPAVLSSGSFAVDNVEAPVMIRTGAAVAAGPDSGTGRAAAPGSEPALDDGWVAPAPPRASDRARKARADRGTDPREAPERCTRACRPGPRANLDRPVGAGSSQDPAGRPDGRQNPSSGRS